MDADAKDEGYKLPPDFQENTKEALVDFTVTDSTELWLIDLPKDQVCFFLGGGLFSNTLYQCQFISFQYKEKDQKYASFNNLSKSLQCCAFLA